MMKKESFFISYAHEDQEFVGKLYDEIADRGFQVWFDEKEILLGKGLREQIDSGILKANIFILVITGSYLEKYWTKLELDAILGLESKGLARIIPVLKNITIDQLREKSPLLAGKALIVGEDETEHLVNDILLKFTDARSKIKKQKESWKSGSETNLPVILAGCGWWARNRTVIPFIQNNPSLFKVVGITSLKDEYDEYEKLIVPTFNEIGLEAPPFYPNLYRAINDCKKKYESHPISVIINTPNKYHEELSGIAIEANCHVYAERPINRTSDDLRMLISIAKQKRRILFNGVQRRLEASFKYIFHVIENGINFSKLANITCILRSGRTLEGWRTDRALSGGGIIIDEGYHLLDAAMWFLEAASPGIKIEKEHVPENQTVFQFNNQISFPGIETSAIGFVKLPEDVILNFDLTYTAPERSIFEMIELRDVEGNLLRLLRNLAKRSTEPGRVLHQLRSGDIIGHGFLKSSGNSNFSFVPLDEASGANNTGPIQQFYQQVINFENGSYDFESPRTIGLNECAARFVLNTQELIASIYNSAMK